VNRPRKNSENNSSAKRPDDAIKFGKGGACLQQTTRSGGSMQGQQKGKIGGSTTEQHKGRPGSAAVEQVKGKGGATSAEQQHKGKVVETDYKTVETTNTAPQGKSVSADGTIEKQSTTAAAAEKPGIRSTPAKPDTVEACKGGDVAETACKSGVGGGEPSVRESATESQPLVSTAPRSVPRVNEPSDTVAP